jgi:transcriptional regulator with XRE-family HTH domain
MTTAELAAALGVDQSMISRYESGKRAPRAPVLLRLLRLAEGVERNPILKQLSILQGRPVAEEDALREADIMDAEAAALRQELEIMADPRPNLARFAYLAPKILHAGQEIDGSLNTFLELWLSAPEFREKAQCFRDAARFLEIAIARSAANSEGGKRRYRVLLPVEFADGRRHPIGEIVELSLPLAKLYSHALRQVESDPVEQTPKRA